MCTEVWAQLGVHLLQAELSHCRCNFFQSTQLSGCAEWGGEGEVDYGVFARAYLEGTIRAVLNWDPCLRGLSGW